MSQKLPGIYNYMGVRLQSGIDVARLQADVAAVISHCEWIARQQQCWHAIPLRSHAGGTTAQHVSHVGLHNYSPAADFKNTPYMQYCPYIEELVSQFGLSLYKVRLMKMDAKSSLGAHTDTFYSATTCRLHIVVCSQPNVTMTVANKCWHLEEGSLYFTNVRQLHSVKNDSDKDRIHIVFDVEWCAKLEEMLNKALENATENIK